VKQFTSLEAGGDGWVPAHDEKIAQVEKN
jgi:hypothetical protein